jgi:IclR helix-turn-helix domain.
MAPKNETSTDVLDVIGNKYAAQILAAAEEPLSARELEDDFDIPIATAYRRIEELTEAGLLEEDGQILTEDRQRSNIYRRSVEELSVEFDEDGVVVSTEENEDTDNSLDRMWGTISSD